MSQSKPKLSDSPRPLYRQIKEAIKGRILEGELQPHDKLDSENELMAVYGVSRITVRQALRELQGEGLVFSAHGKGTFVSRPRAIQSLQSLEGFEEAMAAAGYSASSRLISARHERASPAVRKALNLREPDDVLEIRRIRYVNREPVSLDVSYFPTDIGDRLLERELARDLFPVLENELGISLGVADLKVGATAPDENTCRLLRIGATDALLQVERLTYDINGRPVDFEYLLIRGDAYQYQFRVQHRSRKSRP